MSLPFARRPPLASAALAACLASCSLLPAQERSGMEGAFAEANRLFEREDYERAASAYSEIVAGGEVSAPLFFNLGTARARLGRTGEAVLWFRRALLVAPGMPEARQSLAFLRNRTGLLEFERTGLERLLASLAPSLFRWTFSLAAWGALFAAAVAIFVRSARPFRPWILAAMSACIVLSLVAARFSRQRAALVSWEQRAAVIAPGVEARVSPVPGSETVLDLPPGSEVRSVRVTGAWTYVEMPGDLRGWVRSEEIAPLWPPGEVGDRP